MKIFVEILGRFQTFLKKLRRNYKKTELFLEKSENFIGKHGTSGNEIMRDLGNMSKKFWTTKKFSVHLGHIL